VEKGKGGKGRPRKKARVNGGGDDDTPNVAHVRRKVSKKVNLIQVRQIGV
jgi:hypothetical protein